ncbi:winged helix-turn-helix domain-containing protein [Micromonospora zhanjiangensis]|uniref:Winged helix-turn-helix domain-containing protein n=1 Tax=Micromonospora zhanjiangensis TaxID=1522057 RepID=A0ABV8KUC1_9ACTN
MPYEAAYERIARELRDRIVSGQLKPGDRLPSLSQLKAEYGVSDTVIRNVMLILKTEGLTEGRAGSGVFVRDRD